MSAATRKRSPRAPSIALGDAIEKISKIYDMDRCHAAPLDGVARHIGYKDAGNGRALSALASLGYYGLLERPKEGMAAVSKDVEVFRFAPNETIKRTLKTKWLKTPLIFAELLEKYPEGLPSDATLKFELIQRGFAPNAADQCLQVFLRSVEYAQYFEQSQGAEAESLVNADAETANNETRQTSAIDPGIDSTPASTPLQPIAKFTSSDDVDRIPIRLAGGRRAWIEIPMPFYEADKERLKKQIDLLLTNDEECIDDLL